MKEKYRDKCFHDHVKGYGILCLQELKFMPENSLSIQTYHITQLCRTREDSYLISGRMVLLVNPLVRGVLKFLKINLVRSRV